METEGYSYVRKKLSTETEKDKEWKRLFDDTNEKTRLANLLASSNPVPTDDLIILREKTLLNSVRR